MLTQKIESKDIQLTVVGLGYVGLPLALLAAQKGIRTHGLDISQPRVDQLMRGESYIDDVSNEDITSAVKSGTFSPTTDAACIAQSDVVVICVPTPLTVHKQPDVKYIESATHTVAQGLKKGALVVLESTTYPGTTQEVVLPILEKESGLKAGEDFFLAFAPERVDPGNKDFNFHQVPKVVGGLDPKHTEVAVAFYQLLLDHVYPVSTTQVAEMTKLLENIYRLVNISMINELALLAGKMNIDIWEVIEAAKTKPYGFQAFYPGPGAGGHCIPLDPFYLSWKAKEYDFSARFIELAGDINYRMPGYSLSKITAALNDHKIAVHGAKVLVMGVAYKKDIADPRESPILRLIELLRFKGAEVSFYDPQISEIYIEGTALTKVEGLTKHPESQYGEYDCVVIGTDHSVFNYEQLIANGKIIIDLRNAIKDHSHPHVYRF